MEIENEFLIAANGEGFYYQGVPSTGTVIREETETDFSETTCVVDDTSGVAVYILRTVGYALTITQLIMCVVGILCIFKGMSNIRKNKEIEDIDNGLNGDDPLNQGNAKKKATIPYFVFSAMLLFGCGIINILKNFATNLM